MSALGLVVLYFLINAPELFVPADASSAQLQALAKGINTGVHLGLVIAAIVTCVNIVVESVRIIGRRLGWCIRRRYRKLRITNRGSEASGAR